MKNLDKKFRIAFLLTISICFVFRLSAQNVTPVWVSKLPIEKGYVYGVGVGKSANLSMAGDKAKMDALNDLAINYAGKFESFAGKCDTILGPDNIVRETVTTIKANIHTTLSGIEAVDKKVSTEDQLSVVYLLIKVKISNEVSTLRKAVDSDKQLRKRMDKEGLLKELHGM